MNEESQHKEAIKLYRVEIICKPGESHWKDQDIEYGYLSVWIYAETGQGAVDFAYWYAQGVGYIPEKGPLAASESTEDTTRADMQEFQRQSIERAKTHECSHWFWYYCKGTPLPDGVQF